MHDINIKTYCTHETYRVPMTNHMSKKEKHPMMRRYLEILRDRNRDIMWGHGWRAAGVGTIMYCLTWTDVQQTRKNKNKRGRKITNGGKMS